MCRGHDWVGLDGLASAAYIEMWQAWALGWAAPGSRCPACPTSPVCILHRTPPAAGIASVWAVWSPGLELCTTPGSTALQIRHQLHTTECFRHISSSRLAQRGSGGSCYALRSEHTSRGRSQKVHIMAPFTSACPVAATALVLFCHFDSGYSTPCNDVDDVLPHGRVAGSVAPAVRGSPGF